MIRAGGDKDQDNELSELRERLRVAENTLDAIRTGQVDALVVSGRNGEQVYTLENADRPYRVLFEEMHEGAVIASNDGVIIYANAQFAQLVEKPLETVIGSAFSSHVDAPLVPLIEAALHRSREHPVRLETYLKGHATTPVQISLTSMHLDETYTCIVVTDLQVHKQNEELARSEALARAILQQVTEAVVVTDLDGRIVRASDAALQLAGRDVQFESFTRAFPLSPSSSAESPVNAEQPGALSPTERCAMFRSDGASFELLVRCGELTDSAGKRIGGIITLSDITALLRAEQKLEASVKKLRSANADLKQFAYAASHDLQEPIRMMTAFTQMMGSRYRGQLDADFDQMLGYVLDGSQRMNTLLHDLLAYLTAGETAPEVADEADCRAAAQLALANLSAAIDECSGTVHLGDLPHVQCVFTHVLQIFQNLFSNALKYRRPDVSPEIRADAERDGAQWIISVRDNGIGIAPEYHDRVFGVFKRLHGREIPGTGIGLAICQKIAEQYRGRIWVESELGQGATFRFTLPAAD